MIPFETMSDIKGFQNPYDKVKRYALSKKIFVTFRNISDIWKYII